VDEIFGKVMSERVETREEKLERVFTMRDHSREVELEDTMPISILDKVAQNGGITLSTVPIVEETKQSA